MILLHAADADLRPDLLEATSSSASRNSTPSCCCCEFGVIGVFVALDLFLFYVFWEVSLVPMYFLIGIWGHDRRIYAARQVLPLHDGRLGADAGRDHLPLQQDRHVRLSRSAGHDGQAAR